MNNRALSECFNWPWTVQSKCVVDIEPVPVLVGETPRLVLYELDRHEVCRAKRHAEVQRSHLN